MLRRRILCSFNIPPDSAHYRHCHSPEELDSSWIFGDQLGQQPGDNGSPPLLQNNELCVTDENGNFGVAAASGVNNNENNNSGGATSPNTQSKHVVKFQYEVQTSLGMTAHDLNNEGLQDLEKAISDIVVPYLFKGHACEIESAYIEYGSDGNDGSDGAQGGSGGAGSDGDSSSNSNTNAAAGGDLNDWESISNRYDNNGDNSNNNNNAGGADGDVDTLADADNASPPPITDLKGLSSKPADEIAPGIFGVLCSHPLVNENAERCYVVDGQLTLIGNGDDISWAEPITTDIIRISMDDGLLNDVHPDIVDVTYRRDGIPDYPDNNSDALGGGSDGDGGNDDGYGPGPDIGSGVQDTTISTGNGTKEAWPWVVLGCGLFVLLAAMFLIRKRLLKNRNDDGGGGYMEASKSIPPVDDDEHNAYLQDNNTPNPNRRSYCPLGSGSASPGGRGLFLNDSEEDQQEARRLHFL